MTTRPASQHAPPEPHGPVDAARDRQATADVVVWLSTLVALLALIAAGIGLFWQGGNGNVTVTSVHGEAVELYGSGLYRHDTIFAGAGNRGTDAVTLVLGIPLLVICIELYRRGSLRGRLLLTGALAYFLYVYASLALGAAYNGLFLVYIGLFSASLFALGLALRSIDLSQLPAHFSERIPRRWAARFMLGSGLVTLVVWLMPLLSAQLRGEPPKLLDSNTTIVTDVLDLGIITPLAFLSGALILRGKALGYLIAFPLIGIIVILAPAIVATTISQISAGIAFAPGEIIGPIAGFSMLGALAIWLLIALLRNIIESPRI